MSKGFRSSWRRERESQIEEETQKCALAELSLVIKPFCPANARKTAYPSIKNASCGSFNGCGFSALAQQVIPAAIGQTKLRAWFSAIGDPRSACPLRVYFDCRRLMCCNPSSRAPVGLQVSKTNYPPQFLKISERMAKCPIAAFCRRRILSFKRKESEPIKGG